MKRPLFTLFIFFTAGILWENYGISFYLLISVAILFSLILYIKTNPKWKPAAFFFIASAAGFLCCQNAVAQPDINTYESFTGTVIESKESGNGYRAVIRNDKEKVLCYVKTEVKPGDVLTVHGKTAGLSKALNPGGFDEKMYYGARRIKYKILNAEVEWVSSEKDMLWSNLLWFREKLCSIYDYCFPPIEAGIMKSVIIGDRSDLDERISQLYKVGGIYHIIAISGLHIGILVFTIRFLLARFFSKPVTGVSIGILLVLYCLLTGGSPSTVRASIICGFTLLGGCIFRRTDGLTSLAAAGFAILIYSPLYLWDLGFLLSFSAYGGIILLAEPLELFFMYLGGRYSILSPLTRGPEWIRKGLSVSAAAFFATLPVGTHYLTSISTYSILVNLILFPTFSLMVVAGAAVGIAGFFSLNIAVFISGAVYFLLRVYEAVCTLTNMLPGSLILMGYLPIYLVCAYYAFVFFFRNYCYKINKGESNKRVMGLNISFLVLFTAVMVHVFLGNPFVFTSLYSRTGDMAVIKGRYENIVVDLGESGTGGEVLTNFLNYSAIDHVDLAVLTTPMHSPEIIELIEGDRIEEVAVLNSSVENIENLVNLKELCKKNKVKLQLLAEGDVYRFKDIYVECLGMNNYDPNITTQLLKVYNADNSAVFLSDSSKIFENCAYIASNRQPPASVKVIMGEIPFYNFEKKAAVMVYGRRKGRTEGVVKSFE